ncbi:hypothetical protein IH979_02025 [Patescibacteria group bacterium]|nr:hypothetical protein [Patescibacteria group bacterium]
MDAFHRIHEDLDSVKPPTVGPIQWLRKVCSQPDFLDELRHFRTRLRRWIISRRISEDIRRERFAELIVGDGSNEFLWAYLWSAKVQNQTRFEGNYREDRQRQRGARQVLPFQ